MSGLIIVMMISGDLKMNTSYYSQPAYNATPQAQSQSAPMQQTHYSQPRQGNPTNMGPHHEAANYDEYQQYQPQHDNRRGFEEQSAQSAHNVQPAAAPEFEKSVKIHGKAAALTIVASVTKKGIHTLNIEGANGMGDGTKKFDWQDKTIIQITATEYRHLLAVLFGFIPFIEFKSHGPQKNKSISVKRQQNGFFFSINEGGKKPKAVPVSFDDAYLLGVYALDVFARNYPNIDSHCLLNTVQTFTQLPYYPVQQ